MDPIQRAGLPHAIAERIIDLISRGQLQPGERLPVQRQLAKDLGVGISSLRESLQSLTAMGLVEMLPGKGTFVSESFGGVAGRQIGLAALSSTQDLRNLLEARLHLDTIVATLACQRATNADISQLRGHFNDMATAVGVHDMSELEKADLAFHVAIGDASNNDVLMHVIRSVINLIKNQIRATPFSQATLEQHRDILVAIEARDTVAAAEAVRKVIATSAEELGLKDFDA